MVFAYGIPLFSLAFPSPAFWLTSELGMTRASAQHADRMFRRNPTDANRERALDLMIQLERHARVIEIFETLKTDGEFSEMVVAQFSRVRIPYVRALVATNNTDRAIRFVSYGMAGDMDLLRPWVAYFDIPANSRSDDFRLEFRAYVLDFRTQLENSNLPQDLKDIMEYMFLDYAISYLRANGVY